MKKAANKRLFPFPEPRKRVSRRFPNGRMRLLACSSGRRRVKSEAQLSAREAPFRYIIKADERFLLLLAIRFTSSGGSRAAFRRLPSLRFYYASGERWVVKMPVDFFDHSTADSVLKVERGWAAVAWRRKSFKGNGF